MWNTEAHLYTFCEEQFFKWIFFQLFHDFNVRKKQKQKLNLLQLVKVYPTRRWHKMLYSVEFRHLTMTQTGYVHFNYIQHCFTLFVFYYIKKKVVEANLKFESFAIVWNLKNNIENKGFIYSYRMSRIDYIKLSYALKWCKVHVHFFFHTKYNVCIHKIKWPLAII